MERKVILTEVAVGYGQRVVVDGITATLEPGELVCLLGRNGTGKSTLLRTLAGFQPYLSGRIMVDDKPLEGIGRKELAHTIGIVLTKQSELQDMTVEELVALGRSPYTGFFGNLTSEDSKIVEEAIEIVGIGKLKGRRLMTMSDGERQKAMIAKTLAQKTPVILLDEPTAFLDYQSRRELFHLLKHLAHEEEKTILMTTHDVHFALRLADKIWMVEGEGMETGKLSIHTTPLPKDMIRKYGFTE